MRNETKVLKSKKSHFSFRLPNSHFTFRIENILFYLILLFLPTQFGKHFWPDFSNILGLRVDYLSPTLYFTDVLIVFLFTVTLFSFIVDSKSRLIPSLKPVFQTKFVSCSLLVIILIIGIIFSKSQLAGWYGMLKLLEFLFFGFYTAAAIKTMKQLSIIVLLFSTGILFESVLGISQYFNQSSIGGTFYYFGERAFNSQTPGIANASLNGALILRPYGTFSHPNVLAAYLTIAMIMVISNFKRFFFGIVLLTGSSALFLTMSRVAIVFWLLILGYFLIPQILTIFKRKKIIGLFVVLVFICSIGIYFSFSPIKYRFLTLSLADESIVKRQELISQSIIMIKNNPIFGVGINNFLFNLKGYYLQPVHNIYLLIAAQTGLVGLAFFGWFLMKTFSQFSIFNFQFSIKQKKINFKILNIKNSFQISNFKFQILSLILVLGLFDHYFLTLQQGQLMFAFVFGLCWAKIEG